MYLQFDQKFPIKAFDSWKIDDNTASVHKYRILKVYKVVDCIYLFFK